MQGELHFDRVLAANDPETVVRYCQQGARQHAEFHQQPIEATWASGVQLVNAYVLDADYDQPPHKPNPGISQEVLDEASRLLDRWLAAVKAGSAN